jgi:hypothetical protein
LKILYEDLEQTLELEVVMRAVGIFRVLRDIVEESDSLETKEKTSIAQPTEKNEDDGGALYRLTPYHGTPRDERP